MRRTLLLSLAFLIFLLTVGAVVVVNEFLVFIETPYRGYAGNEVFIDIKTGDSTQAIAQNLADSGVVSDEWTFRLAVWRSGLDRNLQAGEYHFVDPLSAMDVVKKIGTGQIYLRSITFPEGLTIEEMSKIFEIQDFGSADAFVEAAQRVELIAEFDTDALNLEGYLFPETYSLPQDATADDLINAMVTQFREVFHEELRKMAQRKEMSIRDVVILASLIQKETGAANEHGLVAAVYNNRLRIGMPLQCDPTVIYSLQLDGIYDGNLSRADLKYDSPYNTYRYSGLPPGPIAAPGQAVIEAALNPDDVSYLYFVSRNDGSHEFAHTLREHNRNVQRYQVEYFRRGRARKN